MNRKEVERNQEVNQVRGGESAIEGIVSLESSGLHGALWETAGR